MPPRDLPTDSAIQPGDVVAKKYRVDRVIGAGGMGVVLAATHVALHQRVALKLMLPTSLSSGESVERFLREARAIARLRSKHVPRVLDVGTLDTGEPYMVMELLEGEDLGHLLARVGALPVADAVRYVRAACDALADAHAAGIVHRDMKPDNLFLAVEGREGPTVKVLDFGISKSIVNDGVNLSLTATSAVMGSPLYMSPEQMRASRNVDARTDIWSLGVTLYQLVVGDVPFRAESPMELGAKVLHETPPSPKAQRPDLPDPIAAVITKCLEKNPDDRYPDAASLARALDEASGVPCEPVQPAQPAPPAVTAPRVAIVPGGTPPAGSRTLEFSDTLAVTSGPSSRAKLGLGVGVFAVAALIVSVGAVVLERHGTTASAKDAGAASPYVASAPPEVEAPPAIAPPLPSPSASTSASATTASPPPSAPAATAAPPRRAPRPVPEHRPSAPPAAAPANNPFDHM